MIAKSEREEKLSKYFLLYALISFLGWIWETLYMYFLTGSIHDRGFLTLPMCPIYGSVLMLCYLLLGCMGEERGILRHVSSPVARALIYLCLSFILPTLAEIAVGAFFLNVFDIRLWDYSHMDHNTNGYVALEISLLWSISIFVFMNKIFLPLKKLVFKIPDKISAVLSTVIASSAAVDVIIILFRMNMTRAI